MHNLFTIFLLLLRCLEVGDDIVQGVIQDLTQIVVPNMIISEDELNMTARRVKELTGRNLKIFCKQFINITILECGQNKCQTTFKNQCRFFLNYNFDIILILIVDLLKIMQNRFIK